MATKLPAPSMVATTLSIALPEPVKRVAGSRETLARRGERALVYEKAGWYGSFLYEVDAAGDAQVVCTSGLTTSAAFLDDDHIAVSAGAETWVLRREPGGYGLASGVEKVGGPIWPLPNGMLAVGRPDDALRLLAFRDGCLCLYKGKVKLPADAPDRDRTLTIHDGRVFAVSASDAFELVDWDLAAEWDPSADWDKAVKKLIKSAGVPVSVAVPAPPATVPDDVSVQADGSCWRFAGETAAVEVDGTWRELFLPEGLSGPHYVDVPDRERRYLVARLVHGAVDAANGTAWLATAGRKLMRANLATGACEVVGATQSSELTIGLFPLPDGRVVVVGADISRIIDPASSDAPGDHHHGGLYSSAVPLGGPLIACAMVRPHSNKNGLPGAWLALREIGRFPRDWLGWQLPMYAPSLRFDGRTLTAQQGDRALAFDLEAALAWFPQFAGRNDVPALPLEPLTSAKKK